MMRKITKSLIVASAMTLGVGAVIPIQGTASASSYIQPSQPEKRIVVASYHLTKAQTKDMADVMRAISNGAYSEAGGAGLTALLTRFGVNPVYAAVVSSAAAISASNQANTEVLYAADHGMRVKVTITDSATAHTSYSQHVEFQAVP